MPAVTDDERHVWAPPRGPAQDPGPWRIIRARRDRGELDHYDGWLGGVCGGLATSIGVDVMLVRLAFVLASVGGFGVLAYIALWLFTPRAGDDGTPDPWPAPKSAADTIKVVMFVAAIVGVLGGFRAFRPLGFDDAGGWIGVALIVAGAAWLVRRNDARSAPPTAPPTRSASALATPAGVGEPRKTGEATTERETPEMPERWEAPEMSEAAETAGTSAEPGDQHRDTGATAALDATMGLLPPPGGPPPARPAAGEHPSDAGGGQIADDGGKWGLAPAVLAWVGVLAAIGLKLAVAGLVLFEAATVPRVAALVAASTAGTIVMAVVASHRRRVVVYAAGGTIVGLAVLGGAVWGSFNGPLGGRHHTVDSVEELRSDYEVAIGRLNLDLADLDLNGGEETVGVTVGIGQVDVIVPDDVEVRVDYEVQAGGVGWGAQARGGWDMTGDVALPEIEDPAGTLVIDARLGATDFRVCRVADADRPGGHCNTR